ncbi:MAG: DUF465 domain-containing protein [Rhodospirillales bacterium]|nr:DUF465 domain-containing protein [Rhodospirillales bacterium]
MSIEERVSSLQEKHASLDQNLMDESSRPMPDSVAIKSIKREKLNIKDEIERLKL